MHHLAFLLTILLLAACSPAPRESPDPALAAAIDSIVHLWLRADPTPGIGIAVVHRGDTLAIRGNGLADVERGVPVTEGTVFHVGSVTKAFTAAAAMQLVEEDRLQLATTVGEVLAGYGGPGRAVTIRQLLNHTSGIPNFTRLDPEFLYHTEETTHAHILAHFEDEDLEFEPGSRWAYNNSGYLLLRLILERVSGMEYWEYLWQSQLRPLGLQHSGSCSRPELQPHLATGHRTRRGEPVPSRPFNPDFALSAAGAAGALCSTPRDLVRWARALAAGRFVREATYARMATPTRAGGTERGYGLGLQVGRIEGRPVIFHGGGFEGFRAVVAHLPEDDLTIAVLANGPLPAVRVAWEIARLVLGLDAPDWHQQARHANG